MIEITVPATSANLGAGFDCMGMAWNLYNTFWVEKSDALRFEGVEESYANENNLFYQSYVYVCKEKGTEPFPLYIKMECNIPISRGLGSSASLIAGGVVAYYALHEKPENRQEMMEYATTLEGHPDNAVSALIGGLNCTTVLNGTLTNLHSWGNPNYQYVVWIPEFTLSTEQARKALPKQYEKKDAVANLAYSIFMWEGLQGNPNVLKAGMNDTIHQPYRRKLIEEYDCLEQYVMNQGAYGFYISGSGSSCLSVFPKETTVIPFTGKHKWNMVPVLPDTKGATWMKL
ncbi:MAG: homoserine kinase [Erysipelotrichaceae bacterium]|nr:homoserine kinase [Erysipelotrichaceae bacterium]